MSQVDKRRMCPHAGHVASATRRLRRNAAAPGRFFGMRLAATSIEEGDRDGRRGPDRERDVLRLRFGLVDGRSRTLEEVGKEFNVTRERIRQIEAKALDKMRKLLPAPS